jgi:hypothetical protein
MEHRYLIIRFSNENGVIDAEIGWSSDGRAFANAKTNAHAILPGDPNDLVDMTMRHLVSTLCATLPEQAKDTDEFISVQAATALAHIAEAVHLERRIVYTLDADSENLPPTIKR